MSTISLKMTPLLYMDQVEKSLPFWTTGLGFEQVMEVEDDGKLLFVLLKNGEQELMLNARSLVRRETPAVSDFTRPNAPIYVDVESLAPVRELGKAHEVVMDERKTNYGTSEIILREPGGNLVWFASHE